MRAQEKIFSVSALSDDFNPDPFFDHVSTAESALAPLAASSRLTFVPKMYDIIYLTSIKEAITMVQLGSKRYGFANVLLLLCASFEK